LITETEPVTAGKTVMTEFVCTVIVGIERTVTLPVIEGIEAIVTEPVTAGIDVTPTDTATIEVTPTETAFTTLTLPVTAGRTVITELVTTVAVPKIETVPLEGWVIRGFVFVAFSVPVLSTITLAPTFTVVEP